LLQHFGADDAPLLLALARPRIGEVDVNLIERRVGEHVAQHEKRVVIDEANVRDVALRDALANEAMVVKRFLDADEVLLRLLDRRRDEKASLARSDLEHDRMIVAEHFAQVEASEACVARIDVERHLEARKRTISTPMPMTMRMIGRMTLREGD